MLDAFSARLEACDPQNGHFRSYRVEAGTDLLGTWLVDITFGRIGTVGRRIRHVVATSSDAKVLVDKILSRRSTAKRRIGTNYRFTDLHDPSKWHSRMSAMSGEVGLNASARIL